jgi:glycerol-3-phosphate dehydrogenase subunit C
MTITYDPQHPLYTDEFDVRNEASRVFDTCLDCRLCVGLCGSFFALFETRDRLALPDAGLLTPQQQDAVIDPCVLCGLCVAVCPYTPDKSEIAIDFQGFVIRHREMRLANGQASLRERLWTWPVIRRFQKK